MNIAWFSRLIYASLCASYRRSSPLWLRELWWRKHAEVNILAGFLDWGESPDFISLSLSLCSWFLIVYPCLFPRRSVASSSLIGPPAPDSRMPGETWRMHGRTAKHQSSTTSSSERLKKLTGVLRRKNILHFNFRHLGSELCPFLVAFGARGVRLES